jgi:hypothetical protein
VGLYEYKLKEDEENIRFQAAIHGAKLKDTPQKVSKTEDGAVPLFGDPKDYESMSREKREELTQRMMGKHKVWAGQSGLGAKESK